MVMPLGVTSRMGGPLVTRMFLASSVASFSAWKA
jgi:hypothetical protein